MSVHDAKSRDVGERSEESRNGTVAFATRLDEPLNLNDSIISDEQILDLFGVALDVPPRCRRSFMSRGWSGIGGGSRGGSRGGRDRRDLFSGLGLGRSILLLLLLLLSLLLLLLLVLLLWKTTRRMVMG